MAVDRGIFGDLAKIYDRYKFVEAEPSNITIQDDEDLDLVFKQLLKSEKLSYICSRLMNETSWLGYLRTYQSGTTNLPIAAPAIYVAAYYGLALNMSRRKRIADSCDVTGLSS